MHSSVVTLSAATVGVSTLGVAAAPNCSCNALADVFSKHVFVHVVSSTLSHGLFPSFFMHYQSLGVQLAHFHVVLHMTGTAADETAAASIARLGARATNISTHFNRIVRNGIVNRWVKSLDETAWIINADMDEHYTFPCELTCRLMQGRASDLQHDGLATRLWALLRGSGPKQALCGSMLECVSPDFQLHQEPRSSIEMRRRFSLCARIRATLNRGWVTKVILVPASIRPQWDSAHGADSQRGFVGYNGWWVSNCIDVGDFRHYSYSASAVEMLRLKQKQGAWYDKFYAKELDSLDLTAEPVRFTEQMSVAIRGVAAPCPGEPETAAHATG